jgi:hypothetical protein
MTAARCGPGLLDEDEEILTAGAHRRHLTVAVVRLQAQRALVERDRSIEVRDGEMDGAEAQRGRQPRYERRVFGGGAHGRSLSLDPTDLAASRRRQPSSARFGLAAEDRPCGCSAEPR